jgi:hypothetical protein
LLYVYPFFLKKKDRPHFTLHSFSTLATAFSSTQFFHQTFLPLYDAATYFLLNEGERASERKPKISVALEKQPV